MIGFDMEAQVWGSPAVGSYALRKFRVAVVEDDAADSALIAEALRRAGAEVVVHFRTGTEAIAYITASNDTADRPDLVLLDAHLPDLPGLEVLQLLRKNHAAWPVPVVILSGSDDANLMAQLTDNGANAYIMKESDFTAFSTAIADTVTFWRHTREPA